MSEDFAGTTELWRELSTLGLRIAVARSTFAKPGVIGEWTGSVNDGKRWASVGPAKDTLRELLGELLSEWHQPTRYWNMPPEQRRGFERELPHAPVGPTPTGQSLGVLSDDFFG